jgi:hypothetical protein
MYWSDVELGTIQRADLSGANAEVLISGLVGPLGIALAIPEPSSAMLAGMAAIALFRVGRRSRV